VSGLVLASSSAARQKMLKDAGVHFRVSTADINEAGLMADLICGGRDAAAIANALAEQKALTVSRRLPGALVLGGDQVLGFGTEILGKSRDLADLRALLLRLKGKSHSLVSAAALARDGKTLWQHAETVTLAMRDFSEAFLDAYLQSEGEAVLSSVGGCHYEGRGVQLFDRVDGDYFTILGLPLLPVLAALRAQGIMQ